MKKNGKKYKRKKATELIARVASNIRKLRKITGITQEQLQDASGVIVFRCESGKHDMTLTTINTLSKHLNIEPWQLLK